MTLNHNFDKTLEVLNNYMCVIDSNQITAVGTTTRCLTKAGVATVLPTLCSISIIGPNGEIKFK